MLPQAETRKGSIASQVTQPPVSSHYDSKAHLILSVLIILAMTVQVLAIIYGEVEFTVTIDIYWLEIDVSFERQSE